MADCKWKSNVEAWFDGNADDAEAAERHVQNCPRCRAHIKQLEFIRKNIREVVQTAHIAEARFPAFVDGIRSGITPDRRWYRGGIWAMASVAAAQAVREEFQVAARIRWPNDVYIGNRKVAGILVEGRAQATGVTFVVGIGLNVNAVEGDFPAEMKGIAT